MDYDPSITIQGIDKDTTLLLRCFAETDFYYLHQVKTSTGDSTGHESHHFPTGPYQDTIRYTAEIDISKTTIGPR